MSSKVARSTSHRRKPGMGLRIGDPGKSTGNHWFPMEYGVPCTMSLKQSIDSGNLSSLLSGIDGPLSSMSCLFSKLLDHRRGNNQRHLRRGHAHKKPWVVGHVVLHRSLASQKHPWPRQSLTEAQDMPGSSLSYRN